MGAPCSEYNNDILSLFQKIFTFENNGQQLLSLQWSEETPSHARKVAEEY